VSSLIQNSERFVVMCFEGFEGSNSNEHGEEIDKEGNMMKIIERL
jgi:hypothetical protein